MTAVYRKKLNSIIQSKFSKIFQTEGVKNIILEANAVVKFWEMFSFLSVKKVFVWENRVAKQLPKLKWSMKNVLFQLDKLAPYLSQIFESVFRTLLKELNNNVNHVI